MTHSHLHTLTVAVCSALLLSFAACSAAPSKDETRLGNDLRFTNGIEVISDEEWEALYGDGDDVDGMDSADAGAP